MTIRHSKSIRVIVELQDGEGIPGFLESVCFQNGEYCSIACEPMLSYVGEWRNLGKNDLGTNYASKVIYISHYISVSQQISK